MKLEEQVTSLELAKRLKELGVKQESIFYWEESTELATHLKEKVIQLAWNDVAVTGRLWYGTEHPWQNEIWNSYSAFTVAELGEMLPGLVRNGDDENIFIESFKADNGKWTVKYASSKQGDLQVILPYSTEANARARMLIYLLENALTNRP